MTLRKNIKDLTEDQRDGLSRVMASELVSKIQKKHGKSILQRASEYKDLARFRIPTGIFPLDYALSGGFAVGRFTILYGPKSASKTSTALRAIGNAQKMCARCWIPWNWSTGEVICECGEYTPPVIAYINVESTWDQRWAERLGVDPNQILYSTPEYGEQAVDIAEALLESGQVHVVLLDSLAEMVPSSEIEKSAEDGMMGDHPRMIGRAVRKFLTATIRCERTHGCKPTTILINQTRFKIGVMFGNPETVSGGVAPGFLATTEVRLESGKIKAEDEMMGADTVAMKFRVTKQKAGDPYREGEYQLVLRDQDYKKKGHVIDEPQIMKFIDKFGLLQRVKSKWECYGQVFPTKEAIQEALMAVPEFAYQVRTDLMARLLKEEEL